MTSGAFGERLTDPVSHDLCETDEGSQIGMFERDLIRLRYEKGQESESDAAVALLIYENTVP